jgi:F0F1-type ATP synthase assembly protein I
MISLLILIVILLLIGGGIWGWPLLAGALGLSAVTDKSGALKQIAQLIKTYDITLDEVENALNTPACIDATATKRSKSDIARTLFSYLGAIFILAGVGTYIGMFWDSMGSIMRVFVTLGVGYVLLIVLVSALHEKKFPRLILPLTIACAFMMTSGWFVLIHEVFPHGDNWRAATLFVFGMMTLHQSVLFGKYRYTVLVFTALFFVYGFMQVGLDMLGIPVTYIAIALGASLFLVGVALGDTSHRVLAEPALFIGICWLNGGLFDQMALITSANWASVITGVCVMLTAYGLHKDERHYRLAGLGYFIGSILFYSGLFDLVQDTPVELLYLAVTAAILYACVVLQSQALLLTTVIAMLGFIGYFSAEHFANSLGWPLTLVLMGVAFLGVGTIAIKVKRRI